MAIRLTDAYPNRTGPANSDYPHGSILNESAPDAGDGTPLERQWGNDLAGFMQALLRTADITPNGSPDTAPDSQHMDALLDVTRGLTEVDVAGNTDVTLATYDARMAMVRLTGDLTADIDVIVPDTARHYVFIDATTGGFTVTVKTSGGTGIALFKNDPQWLYSDGTNVESLAYSKATLDTGAAMPIGTPFPVLDHLAGVDLPSNDGNAKFIVLTAGLDGAGQYNEGLLTSESISGSAPLVEATAVIDHADSPMNGETVHLWNTEGRYPKPGESPGTVENDQFQGHHHDLTNVRDQASSAGGDPNATVEGSNSEVLDPISDGVNGTPRTGDRTDVKHEQATYVMRIA